jgi:hypothetical protein
LNAAWQPEIAEVVGRFVDASNATLLARTTTGEQVVYKPTAGERPLWDFTIESLAAREVLTYEVARAMGEEIVPETILGDGPYGPGSVQRFVDIDPEFDPVSEVQSGSARLWSIAVLDLVANNADRKLGHLISDGTRTVLWGFSERRLPPEQISGLRQLRSALADGLGERVEDLLSAEERHALEARVEALLESPVHPAPPSDRPPLPWPPY